MTRKRDGRRTRNKQGATVRRSSTDRMPFLSPGELLLLPPEVLRSTDRDLDGVILMLALIHNDLKSIAWVTHQIPQASPSQPEVDAVEGEEAGFRAWANRQNISIINELLNLMRTTKEITGRDGFVAALEAAGEEAGATWNELMRVALGEDGGDLATFIMKVRHNLGHHYYNPKSLRAAYDWFFFTRPRDAHSKFAYVSYGETLKETRFYFADAAAEVYMHRTSNEGALISELGEIMDLVTMTLRDIILMYVAHAARALGVTLPSESGGKRHG